MKDSLVLIALAAAVSLPAYAWNPLETTDEARQRHSAERYDTYRNNGYQAPLGGYQEKLGDPAPYGTDRPGYSSPYSSPYGNQNKDRW